MSLANFNLEHMPALLDKMDKYFGDMDDERLDFKEFSFFLQNFLPNASEEQLEQMFKNIDTDDARTITKKQLMDSAFFTEFIRTSDKMFTLREHEIVNQRQTEVINQLQEYVSTIGRPSEFENERLKQELRDLKEEKRFVDRQNEALHSEVATLQAMERNHRQEIELLQREQEDQVHEIRDLHLRAVETAESTNELVIFQKDLAEERERVKQLQATIRKLTESQQDVESQLRRANLEKKKLEMENDRIRDKNDRLMEDLAQCSDQWKTERVRADTLAETVIILENNLDDQNEIIEERDRLTQAPPVMRINSDGFVLDGLSVTDAGDDAEDLFSQMQDDSSVLLSIPVSVFEATPEPTASPRPGLKRLVKRAKRYAHRRSKSAYMPLVTPRGRRGRLAETPSLLSIQSPLDAAPHSPITSEKAQESVAAIQDTIQREMQGVGERIVESLKPEVAAPPDRSQEVLAALERLQDELAVLKNDFGKTGRRGHSSDEPKWASQLRRDISADTKRQLSGMLEEAKNDPADQGRGGCCVWPWSTRTGSEYQPLNGN